VDKLEEMLQVVEQVAQKATGDSRVAWDRAIYNFKAGTETKELEYLLQMARYPVAIEEFMFGKEYLARPKNEIYPEVLKTLIEINNPKGMRLVNPFVEAVFTGGIGSAKTTTALYTLAYQVYILSCFKSPHATFGMDSTSEILFVFQSLSGNLAKSVDYARFKEIVEQSMYFNTTYPYRKDILSELQFPNRVIVKPISSDGGAIGQNVLGGLIDEVNFMQVVEKSKRSVDRGTYNQALNIYNGLARRRKSRFLAQGAMPGMLCLVSSKRYPGEFTDMKIEEARKDPSIFIYDKRVWDIKPQGTFTSGWFRIFAGDLARKPKILSPTEYVPPEDEPLVHEVPEEYRKDFENDIIGALRDIAGVSTIARHPFVLDVDRAALCFGTVPNIFSLEETDFVTSILKVYPNRIQDLKYPRWCHVDLGVTNDSCGVAIGYCPGFKVMNREGHSERMPVIKYDGLLRITPPQNGEILFYKVREIIYLLKKRGMPIKWVSFDTFQSVDSVQMLKQRGFVAGNLSMDKTPAPYEFTKSALYEGRILAPEHHKCKEEIFSLERDLKTGKIDHPPAGSKDVADAFAGVVYGLTMRRETWGMHGVPIAVSIQSYLQHVEETKSAPSHSYGGMQLSIK
jgi:hypothetical protein